MPSSRARLGSLPWALCVRTLHRPLRSSRHRDISFNRGPASIRHGPGVSSSARLPFCGDKTARLYTLLPVSHSRGNQDRAFKGTFILNYGSTTKPWLVTFATGALRESLFSPSNAITDTKKCYFSILRSSFVVWEELSEFWTVKLVTKLNNCVSPDTDYQQNTFLFLRAEERNHKQLFVKTSQIEQWEVEFLAFAQRDNSKSGGEMMPWPIGDGGIKSAHQEGTRLTWRETFCALFNRTSAILVPLRYYYSFYSEFELDFMVIFSKFSF